MAKRPSGFRLCSHKLAVWTWLPNRLRGIQMRTDKYQREELGFCQNVALAVIRLKRQLQLDFEQAHPDLRDIIPAIALTFNRKAS
jgi:hypothetical protein